jgi:hypothetical protein
MGTAFKNTDSPYRGSPDENFIRLELVKHLVSNSLLSASP